MIQSFVLNAVHEHPVKVVTLTEPVSEPVFERDFEPEAEPMREPSGRIPGSYVPPAEGFALESRTMALTRPCAGQPAGSQHRRSAGPSCPRPGDTCSESDGLHPGLASRQSHPTLSTRRRLPHPAGTARHIGPSAQVAHHSADTDQRDPDRIEASA